MRVLLADDDVELCDMLTQYLAQEGIRADCVHDGDDVLPTLSRYGYAMLILDLMMPNKNGFDVLRDLRKIRQTPVLILTARGEDIDSIIGLELGADDYLAKPCNPRVLVARMHAILRRVTGTRPESEDMLVIGDVEIYTKARQIKCATRDVALTSTEYSLLELLLKHAGEVVTKEILSQSVLGRQLHRYDRSLDMHISNIRKKLGNHHDGSSRIKTVRNIGYLYAVIVPEPLPA